MVCIILKVDLSCCSGCKEWICKRLRRMDGVEDVKLEQDKAYLVVSGEGLDAAEIVRQVKKRKLRVEVELVSTQQPPAFLDGKHIEPPVEKSPHTEGVHHNDFDENTEDCSLVKPKQPSPPQRLPVDDHQEQNRSVKGESLVTERMHTEIQGTKIRTRVTTSQDACTCIRLEETRFIIDKHMTSLNVPPMASVLS